MYDVILRRSRRLPDCNTRQSEMFATLNLTRFGITSQRYPTHLCSKLLSKV